MSDEQFKEFLKVFELRDLIVRIDENTKNFTKSFEDHKREDHENAATNSKSLEKVHTRVDSVNDSMKKIRWMVAGAALVISGVVYFTNFYFNIINNVRAEKVENIIRHT